MSHNPLQQVQWLNSSVQEMRLAFRRVPLFLTVAFLLCVFALLLAWKGGAA